MKGNVNYSEKYKMIFINTIFKKQIGHILTWKRLNEETEMKLTS